MKKTLTIKIEVETDNSGFDDAVIQDKMLEQMATVMHYITIDSTEGGENPIPGERTQCTMRYTITEG